MSKRVRRKNPIAKDVRTPKYRMRVELSQKIYNRKKIKQENILNEQ